MTHKQDIESLKMDAIIRDTMRQEEIRRASEAIQDMYVICRRGETCCIDGNTFRSNVWHNPAKGETIQGEIDRWLQFIKSAYNIYHQYEPITDKHFFKKLDPNKL